MPVREADWLLAVDCATRSASVAVARGGELCALSSGDSDRHHAQQLLTLIDRSLREADIELAQVGAFAVAAGPGAFTSLRIGIATVKGLAFESERPVAAVSTLACIAWGARALAGPLAPVLDARRGEVYAGGYRCEAEGLREAVPDALHSPETLARALEPGTTLVGELPDALLPALQALGRDDLREGTGVDVPARAIAVAELGDAALARGEGVPAERLEPRYLRRAEAEEKRLAGAEKVH